MGTWGTGSFENDTAGDWIWGLKPAKKSLLGKPKDPFAYPMAAIDRLLRSDLYLDANECDEAIAAAECIAAANGSPPASPPKDLKAWLASLHNTRPDQDLLNRTTQALQKVRNDEQSETRQLWKDSEHFNDWQASIDNLISRLTAHS